MLSSGVPPRFGQGTNGSTHGLVCDLDESKDRVNEPRQTVCRCTYPYATSSRVKVTPSWLWFTSFESFSKAVVVATRSSGSFSDLPKIFGKKSVINRPRRRFASVTASGPPFLKHNQHFPATPDGRVPITSWARFCPCALWAGIKQPVSKNKTRTSSGCDGVDVQLRGLNGYPSCRCLINHFVSPVKSGDICGGSTDIKPRTGSESRKGKKRARSVPDDGLFSFLVPTSQGIANDTSRRTTQDALQPGEILRIQ